MDNVFKIAIGDASGQKYEFLNPKKVRNINIHVPRVIGNPFSDSLVTDDTWYAYITSYAITNNVNIEPLLYRWLKTAPVSVGRGTINSFLFKIFRINKKNMSAGNFPFIPASIIAKEYKGHDIKEYIISTTRITHHSPITLFCTMQIAKIYNSRIDVNIDDYNLEENDKILISMMFNSIAIISKYDDILKTPYAKKRRLEKKGISAFCIDTLYAVLAMQKLERLSDNDRISLAIRLGGDTDSVGALVSLLSNNTYKSNISLDNVLNSYWRMLFYSQITNIRLVWDAVLVRIKQ